MSEWNCNQVTADVHYACKPKVCGEQSQVEIREKHIEQQVAQSQIQLF